MQRRIGFGVGAMAVALLGLGVLAAGGRTAWAQAPTATTTAYDVVYRTIDGTELKLDVAMPARGDGPFPVVLLLHGGGWRGGNKESLRISLANNAAHGYVAVAPQYRFCPKDPFPAQIHDVKAAVRWIKTHAKEYKADPDHVGAAGVSAGAHLAMLLATTGPADGLEGDVPAGAPSSKVQAVVSIAGPTDLTADDFSPAVRNLIKDFLGGTPQEKPELAAKASPVTYLGKGDAPILAIQGIDDPVVPSTQATKLAAALTKTGAKGRVEIIPGALGHGPAGPAGQKAVLDSLKFLDEWLKPAGR